MDSKCRIKEIYENSILIELETGVEEARRLTEDVLSISLKKYREKRSLDANAYLWVLCTKIADVIRSSKDEVYEEMLQKYGVFYQDENGYVTITVKSIVDMSQFGHWRFIKEQGNFKSYMMIKGTSEYDTKEMAHFLDMVVQEAKELDIETETPENIERMKQSWGVEV